MRTHAGSLTDGGVDMLTSAGHSRQLRLCLALSAATVAAFPILLRAAWPEKQRRVSDKLRYGPGTANHPVGVIPSAEVRIPPGWPTGPDGSITCLTCHQQLPHLEGRSPAYLRGMDDTASDSIEFCMKCHSQSGRRTAKSMHWMAVRKAHLKPNTGASSRRGGLLDDASRRCLECHDGVTAGESANSVGRRAPGSMADRTRNHPVGVSYPNGKRGKFNVPFRPASLLPQQVALPGGKVSCVSCHNLYDDDRNLLTVPIERSQLCFTCHELD